MAPQQKVTKVARPENPSVEHRTAENRTEARAGAPGDAYPARISETIAMLRDEPKDKPDKFIGRTTELRTIMRAVHGSLPTKRRDNLEKRDVAYQPAVLQMITGGPGAGKTSLLKEVERQCQHHGCRVIRLLDDHLENPATLTQAIRDACHWWGRDTLGTLGRELASNAAAVTDAVATGWIRRVVRALGGIAAEPGSDLEAERMRAARAVLACWQRDEPADPTGVLQLLSRLGPTVITMDEAHLLDRYLDTDRTSTPRTVIRTLATPDAREGAGVPNCLMIVAGLNDLHPTITELGTFRQTPFQLRGFSEGDVHDILAHWIELAGAPDESTAQAKENWIPTLAEEFSQWPHHTIGAAMGARAMLEEDPAQAAVSVWALRAIREIGNNYRENLYAYVTDIAQQERTPLESVLAVAHAMHEARSENTQNQEPPSKTEQATMSIRDVELLIGRTLEAERQARVEAEPTGTELPPVPDTVTATRTLLRSGVLEYADIDRAQRLPGRVRIAVPSLGRYLRNLPMAPNGPAQQALAQTRAE